jgi:hypothetical protein
MVLPVEICEVKNLEKAKTEWGKESMLRATALIDITNLTTTEEELISDHYDFSLKKNQRE